MSIEEQLKNYFSKSAAVSDTTKDAYLERLSEGSLSVEQNRKSHFCAYFLPYDKDTRNILVGDHVKAMKWLSPGGHVDEGETFWQTLNREIEEELGVKNFYTTQPEPFWVTTITEIKDKERPCKIHYDTWFLMETDGKNFKVDMSEYHEVRWLSITEAIKLTTDPANIEAFGVLSKKFAG